MNTAVHKKMTTKDMVFIGMFAVLMAISAWINIPGPVPFTVQTLGVFAAIGILGGKRGTIAVIVYILMGLVGLPVFSGFKGGPGVIVGMTGGYIVGFIASALVMWGIEKAFGRNKKILILSMFIGLVVCYAFGTAWFMAVYTRTTGSIGLGAVLSMCVLPFIIPDCVKIIIAYYLTNRLEKFARYDLH